MKSEELFRENAYIRNFFVLLSVLAVSGHFIDQCQADSWVSKGLFLFIFSFYMPLLVFIFGTIFKKIQDDKGKILRLSCSSLALYALMTFVISITKLLFCGKDTLSLLSESESPWIFYSFSIYLLLGYCVRYINKKALLLFVLILALFCDYSAAIGNFLATSLALSRTIIFCPFFMLGWMCGIDFTEQTTNQRSFKLLGICALAVALFTMVIYIRQCEFLIPLFTGKNAYTQLGREVLYGPLYRILTYAISIVLIASIMAVTPRRSLGECFDALGEKFILIYFFHYPILCIMIRSGVYDFLIRSFGRKCGRVLWILYALICVVVLSGSILKSSLFYGKQYLQNYALKTCLFILVGIMILNKVNDVIVNRQNNDFVIIYQSYSNFYREKNNSLDAVYIGSSVTRTAWLAPLAWKQHGITIFPFSSPSQPFVSAEYLIREARKTQPNAVYIVPISLANNLSETNLHYAMNFMPLSWNKVQMIWTMGKYMEIKWSERLEYLIPLIRFHSRWNKLNEQDFVEPLNGFYSTPYFGGYLNESVDVSSSFRTTNRTVMLPETIQNSLNSLLKYCETEHLNVLFVEPARLNINEYELAKVNSIKQIVKSHGYPVLSINPSVEEVGLDTSKDYYDASHTNIHGAIKITDYISRYLIENYGFEDKRGDPSYSSWDEAYTSYTEQYASAYTLDVEWEGEPRDFTLAAPTVKTAVTGKTITTSWNAIPGADGYRIYSKDALQNSWQLVDSVGADVLSYDDPIHKAGTTYYYTVVAYRKEDGIRYWGDYNFSGITAKALLDPPKLLSLKGNENDLTLSWKQVQDADGYSVLRRLPSKSWIEVADIGDALSFTDTHMLSDMPYQYTVRAYYLDDAGSRVLGSHDTNGLIYTPDLDLPKLLVKEEENGAIRLSWEKIEGIQGYIVYRKTQDSDWEQLTTGNLSADSTEFSDITARTGVWYSYKVEAYIRIGEQERIYELRPEPEWITIKDAMYDISTPEIVYLEQTWDQVHIAWEAVEGASSYRVYRRTATKDGDLGEWGSIKASVTATTYLDKPPAEGEYQYLIQPLFIQDDLTYYGGFDEEACRSIIYSNIA